MASHHQSSALQNAGQAQIYGQQQAAGSSPQQVNLQTQPNNMGQGQMTPMQVSTLVNNSQSMSMSAGRHQHQMHQQQMQSQAAQQIQQMQYQQMLQQSQMSYQAQMQGQNQFNQYSASMATPQQVLLGGGGQALYGAPPAQMSTGPTGPYDYLQMQQSPGNQRINRVGLQNSNLQQRQQQNLGHAQHYHVGVYNVRRRQRRNRLPYYQRKHVLDQRKIIHKPWSRPMAAQHLAATKIQSAIRGFLYRRHMNEIRQAKMQGVAPPYHLLLIGVKKSGSMAQARVTGAQVSAMQNFSATQSLRQKFLTSPFNVMTRNEEQCMREFCAGLIQATYKMSLTRRLFKYHRFAMYHIAAIQIQWAWRGYQERKRKITQKSKDTVAAEKIQNAWRAFTNVKIFKYYKDLINFKQKGEPMQLLKSINPTEAGLLDAASRCHIRFRLGGDRFPPLIYYKIFTHGGVVDINAFAPRDYNAIKKEVKKEKIDIKYDRPDNDNHDGWYQRIERNGWRPISDKILTPGDRVELESSEKAKKFHFIPAKRKEQTAQQRRNRKIRWLRKLYRDAKNAELIAEQGDTVNQAAVESARFQKQLESLYDNPFDDKRFQEIDDENFDDEVNNLIEWCEDLDFDKYCESWHTMATSAKPTLPNDDNNVQVLGLGLGDITIGLGQNPAAMSQQLPGFDGTQQLGTNYPNQNLSTQVNERNASNMSSKAPYEMAQKSTNDQYLDALAPQNQMSLAQASRGSPVQNAFLASKTKEDIFLKNNLEYEQRLKTHLFQFEDDERKKRNQSIEDSQASERQESRAFNHQTPGEDETTKLAGQQVN